MALGKLICAPFIGQAILIIIIVIVNVFVIITSVVTLISIVIIILIVIVIGAIINHDRTGRSVIYAGSRYRNFATPQVVA